VSVCIHNAVQLVAVLRLMCLGGVTGIHLASCEASVGLHDSFYVVGHFHVMASMVLVCVMCLNVVCWADGSVYDWSVALMCVFMPMLSMGLCGVTRRIHMYADSL